MRGPIFNSQYWVKEKESEYQSLDSCHPSYKLDVGLKSSVRFICTVFYRYRFLILTCFLVQLSFPPLQVMGLAHQRCPGHRHFQVMLQNRVKRLSHRCLGPAAMDSAIAPASFSDIQRPPLTSETVCSGPAMGSFCPVYPERSIAVQINIGRA